MVRRAQILGGYDMIGGARRPEASDYFPEPADDGRIYDPDRYNEVQQMRQASSRFYFIATISGPLFGLGVMFAFVVEDGVPFIINHKMLFLVALSIFIGSLWTVIRKSDEYETLLSLHNKAVADAKRSTIEVHIKNHETMMNEINRAQRKGDIIVSGTGNNVLVNSQVINSFNTIKDRDPELARAIATLTGLVENSQDPDAADLFNTLHSEISKEKPDRRVLKSLWTGLTLALPVIKNMTDVVNAVNKYFVT